MAEIIFTLVLLLVSALLNHFSPIPNAIIENLVELVPLIMLTGCLWWNHPRNYMYVIGIFNRNVKYQFSIKLENCDIDQSFFDKICENIKNIYGNNNGKKVKETKGTFRWQVYLEIDATIVELEYDLENRNLYVDAKAKTRYRYFINDIEKITDKLRTLFAISSNQYNQSLINIRLWYLNKSQEEVFNPFMKKFFAKFNKMIMNLRYTAFYGSVFTLTNNGISVIGSDLMSIKRDIKKEMLLF